MSAVLLLALSSLLAVPALPAQSLAGTVNAETATPAPGVGHDYIHLLNETVDPASGNVNITIAPPMPKGRGLTVPFQIQYNSAGLYYLDADGMYPPQWSQSVGQAPVQHGGWTYSMPWSMSYPGTTDSGCPTVSNATFTDANGTVHNLYIYYQYGYMYSGGDAYSCGNPTQIFYGGDPQVSAVMGQTTPLIVLDSEGTAYSVGPSGGLIEDRNGNKITVSSAPLTPLMYQDTTGRSVVKVQGTSQNNSVDQVLVGGLTYQIAWTAVTTGTNSQSTSYSVPQYFIPPVGLGYTESCQGQVLPPISGTQNEISSITLPNGTQYQFYYGMQSDSTGSNPTNPYGLLSEIIYPSGGWVRYTWTTTQGIQSVPTAPNGQNVTTLASTSGRLTYTDGTGYSSISAGGDQACQYLYTTPVVHERQVSFDGTSLAQDQVFSNYSTWWPAPSGSALPSQADWTQKSTTVSTTDKIANTSYTKSYTYGAFPLPPQPNTMETIADNMPVEHSITTQDWNNNTLDVETKGWYNQFQLACDFHTPNNIPSLTPGHFYQYVGSKISDDKEFNIGPGQVTNPASVCPAIVTSLPSLPIPARETLTTYQSFINPVSNMNAAPLAFSEPQSVIEKDSSGSKIAETDYFYDEAGSISSTPGSGTVTNHDDTNYPAGTPGVRGNATTIKKLCFGSNCSVASATTNIAYDLAGQVVSVKDPCGNGTCSDMVAGSNHVTTYSYQDQFIDNPQLSKLTDAYLSTVTLATAGSVTQHRYYYYRYSDGQLTFSQDDNNRAAGASVGTTYQYNDSLSRLTATLYPDGGASYMGYNDTSPSPSRTTCRLLNSGSGYGTSCPVGGASSGNWVVSTTTYDGMWHPVATALVSDPDGADTTTTSYYGSGLVHQTSNPFRTTSDSTYGQTTFQYDALGHKTQQQNSDGSAKYWCYNGVQSLPAQPNCHGNASSVPGTWVDAADEKVNDWQQVSDAFDLRAVEEPNGASTTPSMETDYSYNGLDHLISVNQTGGSNGAGARSRTFSYDSFGWLHSAYNPETGTMYYTYDANGNVATRTDARNVVTHYWYDGLNRLNSKTYSNAPAGTLSSCYLYDTATYGIGRLGAEWTQGGSCSATAPLAAYSSTSTGGYQSMRIFNIYDAMGRTLSEQQCTPNTSGQGICTTAFPNPFTLSYLYDLAGNPISYTNGVNNVPNVGTVSFGLQYDGAGRLQNLNTSWNPTPGSMGSQLSLFTADPTSGYTAAGAIQNILLGDNIFVNKTYDNRLRTTGETATHP